MEENRELLLAWDFVENTGVSIFLTGKAGTGKTTFLHELKKRSPKRMALVAPTGVAAINAGGQTIHSFFQLPLSPYVPNAHYKERFDFSKEKKKLLRTLDLLVIDEISMVRSDLLDAIDSVMRRFRDPHRPFGGVQLLMIGDLQQLTPVVTATDHALLQAYYNTPYFFGSKALMQTPYVTLELKHVYRQQDPEFIALLNNIREGHVTPQDIALLNQRCIPEFHPRPEDGYIRLTTHNNLADSYNENELSGIASKPYRFSAEVEGTFPEYAYPTDVELTLKEGAQVMFVKNDPAGRFYNGRIGRVTSIDERHVSVACPGDDSEIEVEPMEWENAKYELNDKTKEIESIVQGVFRQLPLRLAWAITIHKSQGLTFEHAIIDAAFSFAAGQVYVALSRCKSLAGLVLAKPVVPENIMNDSRVGCYIAQQGEAARKSISMLPALKEQFHIEQLRQLFDFSDLQRSDNQLARVLEEHFSSSYPRLAAAHRQARKDIEDKVVEVSRKWIGVFVGMNGSQLLAPQFAERVKRSATYFLNTVTDVLGDLLPATVADTDSKHVRKRFDDAVADMCMIYEMKTAMLKEVAIAGFSPATFMRLKQRVTLGVLDGRTEKPEKRNRGGRRAAEKAEVNNDDVKNQKLFEALRRWRWNKSVELAIPPYTIIKQKALIGIANNSPQTIEELIAIPYFGKKSAEQYGEEILSVVLSDGAQE
ncbi:MAG: AAA family ATPase [Prevotella sp.]|uniref:HRDC domain-containing protein n=1 Tax=Prevotella sp. TaxID=59823 RepID=UPI002A2FD5B2|nr:HRDC domain-containing protein [Prevotella sp.]MDD7318958.1 AAA family ATPase [Prevotellaceae bacterium]MDY4019984.1 AAA family ATPase [Prevotella sp.]